MYEQNLEDSLVLKCLERLMGQDPNIQCKGLSACNVVST
jgi:hypothetical protein